MAVHFKEMSVCVLSPLINRSLNYTHTFLHKSPAYISTLLLFFLALLSGRDFHISDFCVYLSVLSEYLCNIVPHRHPLPLVFCSATLRKAKNLCFSQFIVLFWLIFCFVLAQPAKQSGKIFSKHSQYSLGRTFLYTWMKNRLDFR